MAKVFKILGLFFLSVVFLMGPAGDADAAKKKKKVPSKPSYVGPVKCNGSCHDPYYQAWLKTPHGKAFESLKPGVKGDEKKKAGLDPEKDYTADAQCLRCHTNGYAQRGGFKAAGSKSKKTGKSTASKIDPEEPNKEQVGCEMCHSVAGGAQFRVVMKNTKGDFKKEDTEKYGQRWDYANVCTRCHNHPQNPFNEKVDKKYAFDYEAKKGQVHDIAKFWNEDNEDQKLEKVEDRAKEESIAEKTPLVIESFSVKEGKLKFKKGTKPYSSKKKKFYYQK